MELRLPLVLITVQSAIWFDVSKTSVCFVVKDIYVCSMIIEILLLHAVHKIPKGPVLKGWDSIILQGPVDQSTLRPTTQCQNRNEIHECHSRATTHVAS